MHVYDKNIDIFHLLSEAVSEGIIVVNKDQLIVSINQKAAHLFEYAHHELLGKPLSELIPEKDKKIHNGHFAKYCKNINREKMAGGRCVEGLRKTGEVFPLNVKFTLFRFIVSVLLPSAISIVEIFLFLLLSMNLSIAFR